MREANPTWAPALNRSIVWADVDGDVVILDPAGWQVRTISGTGALVWQLLDGVSTIGEIAGDISDVFKIPLEAAVTDVFNFAAEMVAFGLAIEPSEPSPAEHGNH